MTHLDVHILTRPETPADWQAQCLDSVRIAARVAGDVTVTVVPGYDGHIGRGRAEGFRAGSAPYVTYVDDDDQVAPCIFAAVHQALVEQPDAVFTAETLLHADGTTGVRVGRHNLMVVKREHALAVPYADEPWRGDQLLRVRVCKGYVVDIPEPLYTYRTNGRSHALRIQHG